MQSSKIVALLNLAKQRKETRIPEYDCLTDIHDGIYECDHVSPWTKSGCNVDAMVMVVGQDWSSRQALERDPPRIRDTIATRGFNPQFLTNKNLDCLLKKHLNLSRAARC